ncbi:TPA: hypothetical protein DIC39_00995 [Patescibacteria group bacterium]|nr:hypothetical protein [Patescibacteria group bacterium]
MGTVSFTLRVTTRHSASPFDAPGAPEARAGAHGREAGWQWGALMSAKQRTDEPWVEHLPAARLSSLKSGRQAAFTLAG